VLEVREYFLFDPLEERPGVKPLRGHRLADGAYEPIPETDGRMVSEVLGLHLEPAGPQLRLYDPRRGAYLLTTREARRALEQLLAVRAADARARHAAAAEAQAQEEAAARAAAQAQLERLRREIEKLRRAGPTGP
jgi:hypothetical protein